jgi:trimethylamine--corrinoid protein Co-methyltransferase
MGLKNEVRLRFLTDEQIRSLHEASLRILERTGVQVEHGEVAARLADHGAAWDKTSQRVRIPPEIVMRAISTTPKSFHLYTRNLERALPVSATTRIAHNSGGPAYIRDLDTGERRRARKQDVIDGAIVVDALPNIDSYTPLVSPGDVHPKAVEAEAFNLALRHTIKPVVSAVLSDREVRFLHQAYSVIAGSAERLREKPMCCIGASPISPLRLSREVASAIQLAAEVGMPIRILATPMMGGTVPITFAGALAVQNAEMLAGLTVAQVIKPGTPVVLTPRLIDMNMRTGTCAIAAPDVAKASACATQLVHSYDLPVDAFALAGGWPALDEQMGFDKGMNALMSILAGVNWVTGAGSIEAGTCSCMEQLVIDNEILSMVTRLVERFEINDETLALDIIDRVGPGGTFMGEVHTVKHLREPYVSALAGQAKADEPIFEGRRDILTMAREKARQIIKTHQVPPLPDDVSHEIDGIIARAREEYSALPD